MMRRRSVPIGGLALAVLTLGIAITGVTLNVVNRDPIDITAVAVATFLAFPAMGLLILWHRPRHPIGYLLLGIGAIVYFSFGSSDYARFAVVRHPGTLPFGQAVAWMSGWSWIPFALLVVVFLPLLFPDGRMLSRRWLIVVGSGLAFALLAFAGNAFTPGPTNSQYPDVVNPLGIPGHQALFNTLVTLSLLFGLFALVGSVTSVVVRYRRADGGQRRQLRWFLFAVPIAMVPFIIQGSVPTIVGQTVVAFSIPLVPVAIAIAVLRYRLYDIDVVINRALVYGLLAAFITGVYVAIVVGLGTLLGAANRANLLLSIVATAIVALAFQPVHARVQHLANRLVYGKRATPYEVMAGFAKQMSGTLALDDVLPQIAEVAGRGVNASRARVELLLPDGSTRASTWPDGVERGEFSSQLAIQYQGTVVGGLAVEKGRGETMTRAEQSLLRDVAEQAGLVLHNVRLAAELQSKLEQLVLQANELQASRQRIVTAEESERRRLGDEIRAGVQRQLETIASELAGAESEFGRSPDEVAQTLNELASQTQAMLDALRELARGIFPPILSDKGLLPALHAQLRKVDVAVALDAPAELEARRFEPQVETAVYFICVEALRRANTTTAIKLADQGDALGFSILGLTPDGDLAESKDRIAAVGGSLDVEEGRITGQVPV